jgi:multiple sugar transport system permease protein
MRTLMLLPWAVSLYGAGTMWFYLTSGQTGIVTSLSYWVGFDRPLNLMSASSVVDILALGNAWNLAPLVGFFLLANLTTIPQRLYDLAAIDCLGAWGRFIHVTLPPLRFTLFVFTSITTVLSLRLFDFIDVMSRGGPGNSSTVLPYLLYDISFKQLELGYGAAMSFYLLALIVAATLMLYVVWGRREEAG